MTNTWFILSSQRFYSWKYPQRRGSNIVRQQISFILTLVRLRNGFHDVKTYPGVDIGFNHNHVIGNLNLRFKTL